MSQADEPSEPSLQRKAVSAAASRGDVSAASAQDDSPESEAADAPATPVSFAAPSGASDAPAAPDLPVPSFLPASPESDATLIDRLAPSVRPDEPSAQAPDRAEPLSGRGSAFDAPLSAPDSSSKPPAGGLMASILARDVPAPERKQPSQDDTILTALRTLPWRRRARAAQDHPAAPVRDRITLLSQLAERADGSSRARLSTALAELHAQQGESALAESAREAALAADPSDPIAVRERRVAAERRGALSVARGLLGLELSLPLEPAERALLSCAQAEFDAADGGDGARALESLHAAAEIDPAAASAHLLRAQLELQAGRRAPAAAALTRAASAIADPRSRASLLVEAGRAFAHAGEARAASDALAQALACQPSPAAALAVYRSQRALGALAPAVEALEALEALVPDARFQGELARKRAGLLRRGLSDPQAALSALAGADSVAALREKLHCALATGDLSARSSTLQAWARAASGSERGLALCELALLLVQGGAANDGEPPSTEAQQAAARGLLREAAIARAPQALLAVAREALAIATSQGPQLPDSPQRFAADALPLDGQSLDGQSLDALPPDALPLDDAAEALRTAARFAADRSALALEREALQHIPDTAAEHTLAEIIGFDAAAEQFDLAGVQAVLLREIERLPNVQCTGPVLALLSLAPPPARVAGPIARELSRVLRGQPLVSRFFASRSSGAEAARFWLEESECSSGEHAAFAAVMAGQLLRGAGRDEIEAYADALDAVRGYPAACFALEIPARKQGDLAALERVHRELASTTESAVERCARRARLGLLSAESDVADAIAWFELAGRDRERDALLSDLILRLRSDDPPVARAHMLLDVAAREITPAFGRALRLRAAAALEADGAWAESAELHRALLAEAAGDPHAGEGDALAFEGYLSGLRRSGQWAELRAALEQRIAARERANGRAAALEALIDLESSLGEPARARAALQRLFEDGPRAHGAARGLARMAMAERDDAELLWLSDHVLRWLDTESERAAELRMILRLHGLLGHSVPEGLLLAHEGKLEGVLWYALLIEAAAIRRSDPMHYYEAALRLAHVLPEPYERASYALRAAETLEATAPERAIEELEAVLLAAPEHPLALPTLARLHQAAGHARDAAEAFARAAEAARTPQRAAELFYAAGALFDDELHDEERATLALGRAAELDVTLADTFDRLRRLLRGPDTSRHLLGLLERRLAAPLTSPLAAELESERAELYVQLGERAQAKAALRSALAHDPQRADDLRRLADLYWDDTEHHEAAEVLVQLARLLESDKPALAEVMFQLGSLYDDHLGDGRRAELAFTRAAALAPEDPRPVERLIEIWRKSGERERAIRALQHLIANSWSPQTKESYILQLAHTLEEMNEIALAEQALEDARRKAPTSMRVLRAQGALYQREDDVTALALHLQRSCNAMRSAIEEDPHEPSHWLHLLELLEQRGRADGAALVVAAADSCGVQLGLPPGPALEGLGANALRDAVLRKLVTRGLLDPLRRLFREFNRELAEFLPAHVDVKGPVPEVQTRAAQGVERLFGLGELTLVGSELPVCLPITLDPLCVCIGEAVYVSASEAERFFLLTRAVVVAKHGLMLLVRAAPERVLLVLHALRAIVKPGSAVQVANEREQRSVTRDLAARLPQPRRTQLRPLLSDLMSSEDLSTRRLASAAFDFGSRVALTVTGNLPAAFDALLRLRGKAPEELQPEERARLLRADPALRGLLSFAISEAYLEGRREVLVTASK